MGLQAPQLVVEEDTAHPVTPPNKTVYTFKDSPIPCRDILG